MESFSILFIGSSTIFVFCVFNAYNGESKAFIVIIFCGLKEYMKLIFVLRSIACFGGVERVVVDKMNYLAENCHQVTLITYEQGQHPCVYWLNNNVSHVDLDCNYFTIYRYSILIRLFKKWKMKSRFRKRFHQLVKELRPDVIVGVSNAGDFMHQILTAPFGIKIVEAHGAFPAIMKGNTWKTKIKTNVLFRAIKKSDLVISLTQADTNCWRKYVKRVKSVPNPVTFYSEKPDMTLKKDGRILYVGRFASEKRIDRLIDAFSIIASSFPSWYIDIYGDGEKKTELIVQIKDYGLNDRIHILEPTHHIIDEYQKSQFLVLCSDNEGFGMVLLEAMACGLPCVSTRCPFGPPEIIEDGFTGLLCDLNPHDLAAKMEWMITHEKERNQMGIKAHETAAKYKKEVVMKMWEKAYEEACDNA